MKRQLYSLLFGVALTMSMSTLVYVSSASVAAAVGIGVLATAVTVIVHQTGGLFPENNYRVTTA